MAIKAAEKKEPRKKRTVMSKTEQVIKYVQFSKKITVYVLVYWGLYRLAQLVAGVLRPELADSLVKLSSGIDTVAIFFGGGYTVNSVAEKGFTMHKEVQKYMYLGDDGDDEKEEVENG